MITPTLEELKRKGFKILQGGEPPEYLGGELNGAYILAKHLVENIYEMHTAKDANGRGYDTIQLNCTDELSHIKTFDGLIAFLENPNGIQREKAA